MKTFKTLFLSLITAIAMLSATAAKALDEITVAYFLEWPMPFQFAKVKKIYDQELGVTVNWRSFDAGTAMSAAMASGDVHISVSQGSTPFVVATAAGQDLQLVAIAVSYSENDNCVVKSALEIDKTNAGELEGKKVGVPLGTVAHYGFIKQMDHFNIDTSTMNIVDMAPAEGAAAFAQGNLDMVCGWGGALRRMLEHGNVLLTGPEKEELGIQVFDVISTPANFAAVHPDLLQKFLKVTSDMNDRWNDGAPEMLPVIAQDAGMDVDATRATIATFEFPDIREQLSRKWLGGGTQKFLKGMADTMAEKGKIQRAPSSYRDSVAAVHLKAAGRL